MLCQKCGANNEENAKFCADCGAPLYRDSSSQQNNSYADNSASIMRNANGNISGYYHSQNQTSANNKTNKKKIGKPVIALTVVIALLAACAVGAVIVKQVKLKKAEEAINAVEMPDIPDFDIDSDFGLDSDSQQSESGYGVIENGVYRNDSIDLSLKPYNSDWKVLSKDEIHQYYFDLGIDVDFDEEAKETYHLEEGSYKLSYDAAMTNTDGSLTEVCLYELDDGVSATLNDVFKAADEEIEESAEKLSESSGKKAEKTPMESAGFMEINSNSYSVKKTVVNVDGEAMSTCYFAGSKIGNTLVFISLLDKSNSINFLDFFEQITKQ